MSCSGQILRGVPRTLGVLTANGVVEEFQCRYIDDVRTAEIERLEGSGDEESLTAS